MAGISLSKVAPIEFAVTHNWELVMNDLPESIKGMSVNTPDGSVSVDSLLTSTGSINVLCSSTEIPTNPAVFLEAHVRGHVSLQPAHQPTNGVISLQLYEKNSYEVASIFELMKEAVFNRETGEQLPKSKILVPKGWTLNLLDGRRDDVARVVKSYELLWAGASGSSNGQLGADPTLQQIQIQIQYTTFRIKDATGTTTVGKDIVLTK